MDCVELVEEVYRCYLPGIIESIRSNEHAYKVCRELLYFLSDMTSVANSDIPRKLDPLSAEKYGFPTSILLIVRPSADHILGAFMVGALPLCFQPLRIIIEAISYGYYIDAVGFEDGKSGLDRLTILDEQLRSHGYSFGKFIKEKLANEAKFPNELAEDLKGAWYKVSNDFLHLRGYVKKLSEWNWSNDNNPPPSWALGAFIGYGESDRAALEELCYAIREVNKLVLKIYQMWLDNIFGSYS